MLLLLMNMGFAGGAAPVVPQIPGDAILSESAVSSADLSESARDSADLSEAAIGSAALSTLKVR